MKFMFPPWNFIHTILVTLPKIPMNPCIRYGRRFLFFIFFWFSGLRSGGSAPGSLNPLRLSERLTRQETFLDQLHEQSVL